MDKSFFICVQVKNQEGKMKGEDVPHLHHEDAGLDQHLLDAGDVH